jgi:hypothetical protein
MEQIQQEDQETSFEHVTFQNIFAPFFEAKAAAVMETPKPEIK